MDIENLKLFPCGTVTAPPSKSVAHRALIAAALGGGTVENVQLSQDIKATMRCISALGGEYEYSNGTFTAKKPMGGVQNTVTADCGESGSTLRFFIPIAAALGISVNFIGAKRLFERPLTPYYETLTNDGVTLTPCENGLCQSGGLKKADFKLAGNISSQFVTGLLFALPLIDGGGKITLTTALESKGYVDLTLAELENFGITVQNNGYNEFSVNGTQHYTAANRTVEGDYSGAAFMLCAAALGRNVRVSGLNKNSAQGDKEILNILKKAGAKVWFDENGCVCVEADELCGFDADVSQIPDLVPPIAALACFCKGESRILNAARLRIKESDRLKTVRSELNRMGAQVVENEDSLVITGKPFVAGGCSVQTHNDHRIAMMCAVAAIRAQSPITIQNAECVAKSYPDFWKDFCKTEL